MLSQISIRWVVSSAVLLLVSLGGGAGDAVAQGEGVHVDPKTPAGKEYALPLESARRDAAGGAETGANSDAAPLFGAGISRRDARGNGKGGNGKGGNGESGNGNDNGGDAGRGGSKTVAAAVAENGTGLSGGMLTALIALAVLLVGGAVGLSLRAIRTQD
jgi:hypothetical protein